MKRFFSAFLLFIMIMMLAACSNTKSDLKLLDKEGIAPFKLTEGDKYLLQSFGMENNSQIISFNAPKEAITLRVNIYCLKNGGNWESIGEGAISIGDERKPVERLAGTFTMLLKENCAIDFNINSSGRASFKTKEMTFDTGNMASTKVFLTDFQDIEINKEIPVAIMAYDSGTSMRSYSMQDYFEPSKFEGMDLVQFVTLTFTNKEFK